MKLTPQGLELVRENSKLRKAIRRITDVDSSTISIWCNGNSPRLVDFPVLVECQKEYKSICWFDMLEIEPYEKENVKRDFFEFLRFQITAPDDDIKDIL
jgi:hypothetical protein